MLLSRLERPKFLSCLMGSWPPCDTEATARNTKYAGPWWGTDRFCLGRHGPQMSVIAPAFSFGLNGYTGSGLA